MTTTPPGADPAYDQPPPSGPPPGPDGSYGSASNSGAGSTADSDNHSLFDQLRRLDVRRTPDSWIGGVCAGIAHRVGLDPLIIRAGFIVLGLFFGLGFFVYFLAWALIPDASDQAHLERGLRGGSLASLAIIGIAGIVALGALGIGADGSLGSGIVGLLVVGGLGYGLYRAWSGRTTPGLVADQGYRGSYAPPPPPGSFAPSSPEGQGPGSEPAPFGGSGAGFVSHPSTPAPRRQMGPRHGRRLSGGAALGAMATGVLLIILGVFIWGSDALPWGGNPVAVAWAVALAALGLTMTGLGIMGRRAGFVGFLALITAGVTSVAAVLPADVRWENSAGEVVSAPATAADIEDVTWGFGEVDVDLTNVDVTGAEPERMNVNLTAGQVQITVPSDLTVVVNSSIGAGAILFADYASQDSFFSDDGLDLSTRTVVGDGPVDLEMDVEVGFGQVRIETLEEN